MALLLRLGTALYHVGIGLAAPFVPKARAWVEGRRGLWARMEARTDALQGCLWMHCASVGEFEQGRPVLEALKHERPDLPVLLTFFSPSGYEARKSFPLATHVDYLPADSARNAGRLLALIRPRMAIFVKYEFWPQHLAALRRTRVPTYLVSAIFRPSQPFFKWYGGGHRAMLACFDHLFVQNEASRILLESIGSTHVSVSGDTRFDRVSAITKEPVLIPFAEHFIRGRKRPVLVAGSTWPADEALLAEQDSGIPLIMVPHEIDADHVQQLRHRFAPDGLTVGEYEERVMANPDAGCDHLIVDRMGHLSRLYHYADITYVGGGFGTGIHNTIEAAAWGRPVIFGPNHARFAEAQGLIDAGAGFCVRNAEELRAVLLRLEQDPLALRTAADAASRYVAERTGATARVVAGITAMG